MKTILIGAWLACVLAFATGCRSTAEGIGEDVERAGEKIQDKVD